MLSALALTVVAWLLMFQQPACLEPLFPAKNEALTWDSSGNSWLGGKNNDDLKIPFIEEAQSLMGGGGGRREGGTFLSPTHTDETLSENF